MIPLRWVHLFRLLCTLALTSRFISTAQDQPRQGIPHYKYRTSPSDLEVGGELLGLAPGQTCYVRYLDLLHLPQRKVLATGDANFGHPVHLSGVLLESLPKFLRAKPDAEMVTAMSVDRYKTNYPVSYLQDHHPLLILRIEGRPPSEWARSPEGPVLGPYIISHASFTPSFRVLAHTDEPQIPWGVVRLDIRREASVYGGIEPRGSKASQNSVHQGYIIARQNCFRCHNEHAEGGSKANRSWQVVARRSVADPEFFNNYVRHPDLINPASRMAPNPEYDSATLSALRDYFSLFASPRNDFGDEEIR